VEYTVIGLWEDDQVWIDIASGKTPADAAARAVQQMMEVQERERSEAGDLRVIEVFKGRVKCALMNTYPIPGDALLPSGPKDWSPKDFQPRKNKT
jgi:GTP cyclohydrolase III